METLLLETDEIEKAAEIIKAGGLVGFPTETVYGLGGNALDPEASKKIYAAKGRPSDNPLIVHIAEFEEIYAIAAAVPEQVKTLARAIWPGPLTMVLPKKDIVPFETTGGLDTVAVRMPMNPASSELIKLSGVPIAAPSANLSGRPSPTLWQHVNADLSGKIDAIIKGAPCIGGIESTVLDMTDPERPMVLRPGLITPERVSEILGAACTYDPAIMGRPSEGLVPKAPGMKYKHYAPKAEMIIFEGAREAVLGAMASRHAQEEAEGRKTSMLVYDSGLEAAEKLFADLRRFDEEGCDIILAYGLPEGDSINYSVMNRMLKSAGYNIVKVN